MTVIALAFSSAVLIVVGLLRAAGASLLRTPRSDVARNAGADDPRGQIVAKMLDEWPRLQPALGATLSALMVVAAVPAAWTLSRRLDGWALASGFAVLIVVLVLGGDLVPRALGRSRSRVLAHRLAYLLRAAIAFGDTAADLIADVDEDGEPESTESQADERELIADVLARGLVGLEQVALGRGVHVETGRRGTRNRPRSRPLPDTGAG